MEKVICVLLSIPSPISMPQLGMTHKETDPIHLQRVHNTHSQLFLYCPSPIHFLPGYNTRVPQQ